MQERFPGPWGATKAAWDEAWATIAPPRAELEVAEARERQTTLIRKLFAENYALRERVSRLEGERDRLARWVRSRPQSVGMGLPPVSRGGGNVDAPCTPSSQ